MNPLELQRLAYRIENLQRVILTRWGGDELEFRNLLPGGRDRRALPEPKKLRELSRQGSLGDQPTSEESRMWLVITQKLEGMVQDHHPHSHKQVMKTCLDLAMGRRPY